MTIFLSNIAIFLFGSLLFLFPNPTSAQESKFYHLILSYDAGRMELKNIAVLPGEISQVPQEGDYRFELISNTGTVLYTDRFDVPLTIHGETIDPKTGEFVSTSVNLDKAEIVINIPFSEDGKVINIYDANNAKVLEIPVEAFSEASKPSGIKSVFTKFDPKMILILVIGGIVVIASVFVLFRGRFKKQDEFQPPTS